MKPTADFNERSFIVIWEMTQACDLACKHCRASALPRRNPRELSTDEARRLIDEVAALQVPVFVLTGGDQLKRPDVFEEVPELPCGLLSVSIKTFVEQLLQSFLDRLARWCLGFARSKIANNVLGWIIAGFVICSPNGASAPA